MVVQMLMEVVKIEVAEMEIAVTEVVVKDVALTELEFAMLLGIAPQWGSLGHSPLPAM